MISVTGIAPAHRDRGAGNLNTALGGALALIAYAQRGRRGKKRKPAWCSLACWIAIAHTRMQVLRAYQGELLERHRSGPGKGAPRTIECTGIGGPYARGARCHRAAGSFAQRDTGAFTQLRSRCDGDGIAPLSVPARSAARVAAGVRDLGGTSFTDPIRRTPQSGRKCAAIQNRCGDANARNRR